MKTKKLLVLTVISVLITVISISSISVQSQYNIPQWVKNTALWWGQDQISDADFVSAIEYMLEQKIIQISTDDTLKSETDHLYKENQQLRGDLQVLERNLIELRTEHNRLQAKYNELNELYNDASLDKESSSDSTGYSEQTPSVEEYCYGNAECFVGSVTEIVDGDTIKVDDQSIRFTLVNTPEYGEYGYDQARNYIDRICPVGSTVLVDEDDGQTGRSYGRMIAVIYCEGQNLSLNETILEVGLAEISTRFCSSSEFSSTEWAQEYGCANISMSR